MKILPGLACIVSFALASSVAAQTLDLTHAGTLNIQALQFGGVGGMTLDASDGSLWVCDGTGVTNKIAHIDGQTGAAITTFSAAVVPGCQFGPDDLALDPASGDLFAFSAVNPVTGARITQTGTLLSPFTLSIAITASAVSNSGSLHVIGTLAGNRVLCRMNPLTGALLSTVNLSALTDDVAAMDFDPVTGSLYALLEFSNVLLELDSVTGAILSQTALSSDLTFPNEFNAGMAFNALGNVLYISKGQLAEFKRIHIHSREFKISFCFGDGTGAACHAGISGRATADAPTPPSLRAPL